MARRSKRRTFDVDGNLEPAEGPGSSDAVAGHEPVLGSTALAPVDRIPSPRELIIPVTLQEEARKFFDESRSKNTRIAYESDWRQFLSWCRDENRSPCPVTAGTVVGYLTWLSRSHPWATISRHLSTISAFHKDRKFDSPRDMLEVRRLCKGIRRTKGVAPERRKKALVRDDLEKALAAMSSKDPLTLRDRAIFLLGFAGAFRRSELSSLDVSHLVFEPRGLVVHLARSKTDQEGKGAYVGIGAEGVRTIEAVRAWVEHLGTGTGGALFRAFSVRKVLREERLSPSGVGKVVIKALVRAGIMQETPRRKPAGEKRRNRSHGAHSLRAGYATQAKRDGRTIDEIMGQARWRSHKQAMEYVRRESVFDNPGSRGVAL